MSAHRNEQIRQVEHSIDKCRHDVELAEAVHRLYENPDFKLIISDGYLVNEALRLTRALAVRMVNVDQQKSMIANVHTDLAGIASLGSYFGSISQAGNAANETLEADSNTLAELNAEDLED